MAPNGSRPEAPLKTEPKSVLKFSIQDAFFFLLLTGLSIAFYEVLRPFLVSIFAAVFLAHLTHVPFQLLQTRLRLGPRIASLVVVVLVAIAILIPISLVGTLVTMEVIEGYNHFKSSSFISGFSTEALAEAVKKIPLIEHRWQDLVQFGLHDKLLEWVNEGLGVAARMARDFTASTGVFLFQFVILLYLLYFLLLHGQKITTRVFDLLPIPKDDSQRILDETFKIVEATLLGSVVVGILEGTLGGLVFYFAGIHAPVLWGVIMAVFSMLPVIGATTVLLPAALYFLVIGDYANATLVFAGILAIGVTTGLLKPKLVGDRAGMHPAFVVLSTIGGLAWLGAVGFFVGPLLTALAFLMWAQFAERYKTRLTLLREQVVSEGREEEAKTGTEEPRQKDKTDRRRKK